MSNENARKQWWRENIFEKLFVDNYTKIKAFLLNASAQNIRVSMGGLFGKRQQELPKGDVAASHSISSGKKPTPGAGGS